MASAAVQLASFARDRLVDGSDVPMAGAYAVSSSGELSDRSDAEPAVKGAALREYLIWYAREWDGGAARLVAIAESLPPELQPLVRADVPGLGLLASSWYPSSLCHAVLDGVCAGMSPTTRTRFIHDATGAVADTMMRGLYKWLFTMVATPSLYARYIGRAWRQLHSTGERRMTITAPGRAESVILDWAGHHPVLCEITTEAMTVLFDRMGEKDVKSKRVACVTHGAPHCKALLSWRA